MLRFFNLFTILFLFTGLFAQKKKNNNSLLFPDLIVSEVVALDTGYFTGYSYAKKFYGQILQKVNLTDKFDLSTLLVKKMTNQGFLIYQDYSPYKDIYLERYDEVFVKADIAKVLRDLGGKSDTILLNNEKGELVETVVNKPIDTSEVQALLFFDKWLFNKDEFILTKTVLGFCPIRKYRSPYTDDQWLFRKTDWFVFPELKKGKLRRLEKRMKYLGHFEYEFSIESKQLFGNDDENALLLEELDSPNWNSYARQSLRNALINRALSGKSKVVDYDTKKILVKDQIKANLGYEITEVSYVDPETMVEETMEVETGIYKEDIKSVIFFEDWYIDLETMRIKKVVKALAPVRFYLYDGDVPKKKVAFIIYLN